MCWPRSRCAPQSLPLLCRQKQGSEWVLATAGLRAPPPGKKAASRARTLPSNPMGACVARPARVCGVVNGDQRPTAACVWSMRPGSRTVVPAPCGNNVSGTGTSPSILVESVCCCILARAARLRCSGETGHAGSIDAPVGSFCVTNTSRSTFHLLSRGLLLPSRLSSRGRSEPIIGSHGKSDWFATLALPASRRLRSPCSASQITLLFSWACGQRKHI